MNAKLNRPVAGAALLLIAVLLIAGLRVPSTRLAQVNDILPTLRSPRQICINPPCGWQPLPAVADVSTGAERRICVNPPCDWKWPVPSLTSAQPALSKRLGGWSCESWPCRLPTSTGTADPSPALIAALVPGGCIDLMCPRGFYRDTWCRCRPLPVTTPATDSL